MALLLNLETTTKICSVALTRNGELLCLIESDDSEYGHAEKLHVFIEQVLKESGVAVNQLDGVAVAGGPGSYTGLRIGVSAAKGLCYALDKPLLAIDPLKALVIRFLAENKLAENKLAENSLIVPMIDARRDEVFMAVYSPDLKAVEETSAQIIDLDFFAKYGDKNMILIGDGAAKFTDLFRANPQIHIFPNCLASARYMGVLAEEKFADKQFEDVAYYEPFYGKEYKTTVSKKANNIRTNNL